MRKISSDGGTNCFSRGPLGRYAGMGEKKTAYRVILRKVRDNETTTENMT
jgi:hypothetical protein